MKGTQMRTPMRRVRGLGAAHTGTQDFWHQRVTSVAGIPLCIALVIIVDYVHEDKLKLATLLGNTFFCFAIGFASAFAILKLSFGV